jgi:hypothetical protein
MLLKASVCTLVRVCMAAAVARGASFALLDVENQDEVFATGAGAVGAVGAPLPGRTLLLRHELLLAAAHGLEVLGPEGDFRATKV